MLTRFLPFIGAMALVVIVSNYLVQFPVHYQVGDLALADLLTWGAFTYPAAFLVTDLTNRRFGVTGARLVVVFGFVIAVALSIWLATPRIAIASGVAFLLAQMLDVSVFNRFRVAKWWLGPLISSVLGSLLDTALFFGLAFSASLTFVGEIDVFATQMSPLFGLLETMAPRWVSWGLGDLAVKLLVAMALLVPYGLLRHKIRDEVIHPSV